MAALTEDPCFPAYWLDGLISELQEKGYAVRDGVSQLSGADPLEARNEAAARRGEMKEATISTGKSMHSLRTKKFNHESFSLFVLYNHQNKIGSNCNRNQQPTPRPRDFPGLKNEAEASKRSDRSTFLKLGDPELAAESPNLSLHARWVDALREALEAKLELGMEKATLMLAEYPGGGAR